MAAIELRPWLAHATPAAWAWVSLVLGRLVDDSIPWTLDGFCRAIARNSEIGIVRGVISTVCCSPRNCLPSTISSAWRCRYLRTIHSRGAWLGSWAVYEGTLRRNTLREGPGD